MKLVKGEKFNDTEVNVDGKRFDRCEFTRCTMVIKALDLFQIDGCTFTDVRWKFAGPAELTVNILAKLYAVPDLRTMIEGTFEKIRSGKLGT